MRSIVALLVLALAPTSAAPSDVRRAGGLAVPRAAHTATLLPSGKVLIAGGCTRDGCELDEAGATAELYDPASGNVSATGPMAAARVGHTATLLPNGKVLIAGGWDEHGVTASAELYDPATGRFSATGEMQHARGGFTATALAAGKVLVVGGTSNGRVLASAELYDPATGRFGRTGGLGVPRSAHTATALADVSVLVAGGSRGGGVHASAEVYDPVTGSFRPTGSLRTGRHKHGAAPVAGGRRVLIVGGSSARDFAGRYASAEVYDARRGTFSRVAPMAEARFKLPDALVPLPSGAVLIAGGGRTVELYEPARRRFRTVGRVPAALAFATATALPGGDVLVAGGYDARIAVTRGVWVYRAPVARGRNARP